MTKDESEELDFLSRLKAEADHDAFMFGYTNVAGLTREELIEVEKRGQRLKAAQVEANTRLARFMTRLSENVDSEPLSPGQGSPTA